MKGVLLIVDDEPDILLVMTANLRREGYEVDTAGDGVEALKKMEGRDYDAVIVDHRCRKSRDGIPSCCGADRSKWKGNLIFR
jgi:two-component system alkaline phosphatase synthesis response regulator PhoP